MIKFRATRGRTMQIRGLGVDGGVRIDAASSSGFLEPSTSQAMRLGLTGAKRRCFRPRSRSGIALSEILSKTSMDRFSQP